MRFADIEKYLKERDKTVLRGRDPLRLWGNLLGTRKGWTDMELGDIVLFYQNGKFTHAGKVYHKTDNEKLSKKLWPDYKQGKPWRYIYFLQEIKEVEVPWSLIKKYSGYDANLLRGFTTLKEKAMDAIIQKHGSVEAFVQEYGKYRDAFHFILITGSKKYKDEPHKRYHFKEGIPGSRQLRDAENTGKFVYYENGKFYAKGEIGKITSYEENNVTYYYAEIKNFEQIGPIDFEDIRNDLSFSYVGQAGINRISEQDYELIVGKHKILALVGATDVDYVAGLMEFLALKGKVWSGWTFRIKDKYFKHLNEQLAKYGVFRVYLHHIKSRGGSGNIEFIGLVDNYVTSRVRINTPEPSFTIKDEIEWYQKHPEKASRTWVRFTEVNELDNFIEPRKLRDYYKDTPINPSTLQNRFAPVVDEFGPYQKSAAPLILSPIDRATIAHLVAGRNVIFYGPPGTGKTREAVHIAKLFCGDDDTSFSFATANAEWTAYDVVGGPTFSGAGELSLKPGFLTWAAIQCSSSIESSGVPYFLIIDEINRANLDLAFGKIFSLLDVEYRDQAIFDESELKGMKNADEYRGIKLPVEFRVLATMNTYDTALLFSLGYAFRRRFAFVEIGSPFVDKPEEKYELNEEPWQKLQVSDNGEMKDIMEEIETWISKATFLQPSSSLKQKLQFSEEFDLTKTLQSLNKRIKDGEFDPLNPYKLACNLSETVTREGVIEAGYAQAVDVVKYTLVYSAIFSENSERLALVRAMDEAVKAYFIPQVEYYLPRARRKMTIGGKSEAEAAISKLNALETRVEKLGLVKSREKMREIVSRLQAGETRLF